MLMVNLALQHVVPEASPMNDDFESLIEKKSSMARATNHGKTKQVSSKIKSAVLASGD